MHSNGYLDAFFYTCNKECDWFQIFHDVKT